MTATSRNRSEVWNILEQALRQRRPLRASYHDHQRTLCPHALGWKNGQARALAYQAGGASRKGLSSDPRHRWRSMLIEEIHDPVIVNSPWQTADNYSGAINSIDDIQIQI